MDDRMRDRLTGVKNAREAERDASNPSGSGGGGEPPYLPGMDLLTVRVETIERRMDRLETGLDGIDSRLRMVEQTLSGIDGKLGLIVAQMPKWWQASLSAGALVSLIVGILGLAAHFHLTG